MWMRGVIFYLFFILFFFLRTSSARGGGRCQTFLFYFFPCSADHERDWPPCKVVFFGLATNALNVRNNNNNNNLYPMDLVITILPVVTKYLPISSRFTPYDFLSRCKFSTLTTRQPMVEFYLLTFPRFSSRKKKYKSYFGKNRTHDFCTTSRCAGYLLDHSGDGDIYT